ncbi:MAG: hypothetical protein AAF573_09240 [Bacteroidota bacterium]
MISSFCVKSMASMVNKIFFIFIIIFVNNFKVSSQIKAVTERGDTIYVYNNGTWSFEEGEQPEAGQEFSFLEEKLLIDTILSEFTFNPKATKDVKSGFGFFNIKYDSKSWKRIPPGELNDEAEFAFQGKYKDIYCMVIAEEIEVGMENLIKIARNMMRENAGANVKELKTELRNVNGTQVIRGVSEVSLNGITFIFDGYYFSNNKGSVQFTTWTSTNLYKKYEPEILDLLNGLVISQ